MQQLHFQAALASAYADLFANDSDYAFGPNGPTPEALAEKMTDSAIAGKANGTGKGFRRVNSWCYHLQAFSDPDPVRVSNRQRMA